MIASLLKVSNAGACKLKAKEQRCLLGAIHILYTGNVLTVTLELVGWVPVLLYCIIRGRGVGEGFAIIFFWYQNTVKVGS